MSHVKRDSGLTKRWKTLESLSVEDYFDDITQIQRWSSTGKLNDISAAEKRANKLSKDPALICRVCNQRFNKPKLLHCLHSFCQSCIEGLARKTEDDCLELICPVCDSLGAIPRSVESLPTNFALWDTVRKHANTTSEEHFIVICANCKDESNATGVCVQCAEFLCDKCTSAHRRVRVTRTHCVTPLASQTGPDREEEQSTGQPPDLSRCSTHTNEEFAFYCHTCSTLVCRECAVEHEKPSHDFEPLAEATNDFRQELSELLASARERLPFMRRSLLEIEATAQEIPTHVDAIADKIRSSTERYIRALREREIQLLDDLEAMREFKTTVLMQQRERLLRNVEDIESACGFTQRVLGEADALTVAAVSSVAAERMRTLTEAELEIQAVEGPEIDYVSQEDALFESLCNAGRIENGTTACFARALGEGLFEATVGKASMLTIATRNDVTRDELDVRIETPDGVILMCNVTQSPVTCHTPECEESDAQEETHILTVSYTPRIHGEHEITILARGQHVDESPYHVHVKKGHMNFATKNTPVCLRISSKGSGLGEAEGPFDVAVRSNGSIVVTDTGNHRIQIFDGRGRVLHHFGTHGNMPGHFQSPAGVCISHEGSIVVTDQLTSNVQVFTEEGVLVRHFGPKIGRGGELKGPLGVTVDEEGQILTADQSNHRIVVLSSTGSFVSQFGSLGTKDGEFNNPSFVAVNQDGDIFVTDTCNHRVQIFDMDGRFIGKFGRPGTGNGEFQYPSGIAIDSSGYVFVSDRTNRVQVFNYHFRYVCRFGGKQSGDGQLNSPAGIDYTPEGRVAVADTANNCVKVFYFPKDKL
ncbi:E3 ubiquitin-protein ligase TRIM71-like [Nematostella vectensis]|uniref:E3 ubiquitin-protein ligase TRIM71-like n=1 Tax=Nematostella vectensis TaxID=45351 RepID=UPI00138FE5A3|nr:E3 ubiquitin-protein ligase TRIM71-like [Nematostella vectensis]